METPIYGQFSTKNLSGTNFNERSELESIMEDANQKRLDKSHTDVRLFAIAEGKPEGRATGCCELNAHICNYMLRFFVYFSLKFSALLDVLRNATMPSTLTIFDRIRRFICGEKLIA